MTSVLFIWVLAQGVLAPPTTETFYTLEACQAAARKAENSLVLFEGQRPDASARTPAPGRADPRVLFTETN